MYRVSHSRMQFLKRIKMTENLICLCNVNTTARTVLSQGFAISFILKNNFIQIFTSVQNVELAKVKIFYETRQKNL